MRIIKPDLAITILIYKNGPPMGVEMEGCFDIVNLLQVSTLNLPESLLY